LPDEGAPFVLERVVEVRGYNFVQLHSLHVDRYFGLVLPHNPESIGVDNFVAALVGTKFALPHLDLGLDFESGVVVGVEHAVA